jgi:D-beta-D-heptose 7-phosphate kinase/D-beta-D-heptose 1-phosphate adenosyltransferase
MEITRFTKLFEKFDNTTILVIGDLMIDEYIWGNVERISPEAPVPVVEVEKNACILGGAGNVLNNLVSLGAKAMISSVVGNEAAGDFLRGLLEDLGVDLSGIFTEQGRITTKKTRIMAAMNQQVIRIDQETKQHIGEAMEKNIISYVEKYISQIDGIIFSDYDKGVLTEKLITQVIRLARENKKPLIVDPKKKPIDIYRGATIITPNLKETSWIAGSVLDTREKVVAAAEQILSRLELDAILITRSTQGMTLLEKGAAPIHIPTRAREVYDVSGAGDTVTAGVSLAIASGASFEESANLANIAAGIAVGKVGTASITREDILEYLGERHTFSEDKIVDLKNLKNIINSQRIRGISIAFACGFFDPLNPEFIKQLQTTRHFGSTLVAGISNDASYMKRNKGRRPSLSEEERLHLISALDCVNYVFLYSEEDLPRLLDLISPDNVVVEKGTLEQDLSFYRGNIRRL